MDNPKSTAKSHLFNVLVQTWHSRLIVKQKFFINWLHSPHFVGHKKLFQIVAAYGQPKTLADNQNLQPGCPWDNLFYFLNSDTDYNVT